MTTSDRDQEQAALELTRCEKELHRVVGRAAKKFFDACVEANEYANTFVQYGGVGFLSKEVVSFRVSMGSTLIVTLRNGRDERIVLDDIAKDLGEEVEKSLERMRAAREKWVQATVKMSTLDKAVYLAEKESHK